MYKLTSYAFVAPEYLIYLRPYSAHVYIKWSSPMTNKYFMTQWPNTQIESQVVIHLTYCELEEVNSYDIILPD